MDRKYAIRNQLGLHFVTFAVVDWIDLFIRNNYCQLVLDSLNFCKLNKGLRVHAYCIMSSHIHLILSVERGYILSSAIRDFKRHTSSSLIIAIKDSRKGWLLWMFRQSGKQNSRNSYF